LPDSTGTLEGLEGCQNAADIFRAVLLAGRLFDFSVDPESLGPIADYIERPEEHHIPKQACNRRRLNYSAAF
jgi:hypothetical protein